MVHKWVGSYNKKATADSGDQWPSSRMTHFSPDHQCSGCRPGRELPSHAVGAGSSVRSWAGTSLGITPSLGCRRGEGSAGRSLCRI